GPAVLSACCSTVQGRGPRSDSSACGTPPGSASWNWKRTTISPTFREKRSRGCENPREGEERGGRRGREGAAEAAGATEEGGRGRETSEGDEGPEGEGGPSSGRRSRSRLFPRRRRGQVRRPPADFPGRRPIRPHPSGRHRGAGEPTPAVRPRLPVGNPTLRPLVGQGTRSVPSAAASRLDDRRAGSGHRRRPSRASSAPGQGVGQEDQREGAADGPKRGPVRAQGIGDRSGARPPFQGGAEPPRD